MKVKTKDFQILQGEHEFEFPVGITVLQGKTGSGKTTAFYAINDCLLNPTGVSDVINWDAKECSVTIENGDKITWKKTKSSSEYINEKTGQPFVKASKLDSTDIGDLGFYIKDGDVVNIQDQWKVLFPFNLKDTELFRLFEDIFNISCSFTIIDSYKKDEQALKSQINTVNTEINSLIQKQNNIQDVLQHVDNKTDFYINELNTKTNYINSLNQDLAQYKNYQDKRQIQIPEQLDITKLDNSFSILNELQSVLQTYKNLQVTKNIELPEVKEFEVQENPYIDDFDTYCTLQTQIKKYQSELKELDVQAEDLAGKINQIKICPTCGRPLE